MFSTLQPCLGNGTLLDWSWKSQEPDANFSPPGGFVRGKSEPGAGVQWHRHLCVVTGEHGQHTWHYP